MHIRIVTDSNAMLPAALRARFGIAVVPLTVVVDGVAHPEDQLDPVDFCRRLRAGAVVSTSAPSPGEILAAYQEAALSGADAVLSIHVGSNHSATVDAARLAAQQARLPITVVDSGNASFLEGCCVWRAAEVLAGGGSITDAQAAAETVGAAAASVFTIGELDRANDGGRLTVAEGDGVPVFSSHGSDLHELGRVTTDHAAAEVMVEAISATAGPLRVGIGDADAPDAAAALQASIEGLPNVCETIRYVVGPSVATHTGAGTFGAVFHPLP